MYIPFGMNKLYLIFINYLLNLKYDFKVLIHNFNNFLIFKINQIYNNKFDVPIVAVEFVDYPEER